MESIKAEDLRKGNIITTTGQPERIRGCVDNLVYFEDETSAGIGYCFGIPLTPEILIKAGFNYKNDTSSVARLEIAYIDSGYPCSLQSSGSGICIARSGVGAITAPVFYVHQLQNLYHILTGEEININL